MAGSHTGIGCYLEATPVLRLSVKQGTMRKAGMYLSTLQT